MDLFLKRNGKVKAFSAIAALVSFFFLYGFAEAADETPPLPAFYLNDKPEIPTVQELSGMLTRPLRLLIRRSNEAHKDEVVQVHAMGIHEGDDLRVDLGVPEPGMRVTVYRLFRGKQGPRYLTMPLSVYHGESNRAVYHEKIINYRSEYLVFVYEKTESPDMKSANLLYFEEKPRNLTVTSMRPNLKFSTIKIKLKDLAGREGSFEKDAQELIDRFVHPRRVYMLRLWKAD